MSSYLQNSFLLPPLFVELLSSYPQQVGNMAVITPYRAQVGCLRDAFRRALGGDTALLAKGIEFGTVDGFQGREADVVIFSCVRAQPEAVAAAAVAAGGGGARGMSGRSNMRGQGPRVGFLADMRRMNVGLTRGIRAMWVVCHAATLASSEAWRPLLQEASARGVLLQGRKPWRDVVRRPVVQLTLPGEGHFALPPSAAGGRAGGKGSGVTRARQQAGQPPRAALVGSAEGAGGDVQRSGSGALVAAGGGFRGVAGGGGGGRRLNMGVGGGGKGGVKPDSNGIARLAGGEAGGLQGSGRSGDVGGAGGGAVSGKEQQESKEAVEGPGALFIPKKQTMKRTVSDTSRAAAEAAAAAAAGVGAGNTAAAAGGAGQAGASAVAKRDSHGLAGARMDGGRGTGRGVTPAGGGGERGGRGGGAGLVGGTRGGGAAAGGGAGRGGRGGVLGQQTAAVGVGGGSRAAGLPASRSGEVFAGAKAGRGNGGGGREQMGARHVGWVGGVGRATTARPDGGAAGL